MQSIYTNKDVKRLLGLSSGSARNYTAHYAAYVSKGANPPQGATRHYTSDDMRLFAFVQERTGAGLTHADVLQEIESGALDSYEYNIPESPTDSPTEPAQEPTNALVPASTLAAYQTLLQSAEKRLQATESELSQARSRIELLQNELGDLAGQNKMLKRAWWKRLLGIFD